MGLFHIEKGNLEAHHITAKEDPISDVERFNKVKGGKKFQTITRIHGDIFNQPKLLPDKITLKIRIHLANHLFSLMSMSPDENYKIHISRAEFHVFFKHINPEILQGHENSIKNKSFKFPLIRTEMKYYSYNKGNSYISEPNLINGILPQKIIFGFVDTKAFDGIHELNPFNFQHFNIREIELQKNENKIPFEHLKFNHRIDDFMEGYLSLLQGTGKLFSNSDLGLKLNEYVHGNNLYCFNLTKSNSHCGQEDPVETGNISLSIHLDRALLENITLIVYIEYTGLIKVVQPTLEDKQAREIKYMKDIQI